MPLDLFPPLDPYASGMIAVGDGHSLYWEECGNPQGIPAVFLHGGPGAGASVHHRRFFNPQDWRIVLFDQRGAGRSQPLASTTANTIQHLIEDIETIRKARGVDRWHVMGGSWGSTLGLAYAETYPERCLSLMLRGICLWRRQEIDWFFYGMRTIFPDVWAEFAGLVSPDQQHQLCEAYWHMLCADNATTRQQAAAAWCKYENNCSTLLPLTESSEGYSAEHQYALAKIECHYFRSRLFPTDNFLIEQVSRIRQIPAVLVQGRYDAVCPMMSAYDLQQDWPEAELLVVPDAGHSGFEPGIRSAMVDAAERLKHIKI